MKDLFGELIKEATEVSEDQDSEQDILMNIEKERDSRGGKSIFEREKT